MGRPDPLASAHDIKVTFSRMGMNSEETVALIAGGHTFGKAHGGGDASLVGPEPEGCPVHSGQLGWINQFGKGKAEDTITSASRARGPSTPTSGTTATSTCSSSTSGSSPRARPAPSSGRPRTSPPRTSPTTRTSRAEGPDDDGHHRRRAHRRPGVPRHLGALPQRPEYFADQYARAWFKLLHRDMGPKSRYLGPDVPQEELIWQDPLPPVTHELVTEADVAELKRAILESGLSVPQLVHTAWSAAASYRGTDKRGGANGGPAAPRAAGELGRQRRHVGGHRPARRRPAGVRQADLAGRHDRPRRLRGGREGRRGRRCRGHRARSPPVVPTRRRR
jgi:catalase-peroxidase